jgi:hypothetical protein
VPRRSIALGRAVHATNEASGTKSRWPCASSSAIAYARVCAISRGEEAAAADTGHASDGLSLLPSPPRSSLHPHAAHQRGPVPPACSTALRIDAELNKRGTGLWRAHRGTWTTSVTTGVAHAPGQSLRVRIHSCPPYKRGKATKERRKGE